MRLRILFTVVICASIAACGGSRSERDATERSEAISRIDRELAPKNSAAVGIRDGLAAAVLIDVSGSMREQPRGSSDRKIEVAKRAAIDLVEQFARFADDHKELPVLLAVYEFSSERRGGDVREVIRMGPPNRTAAAAAINAMRADGGTPIGDAMVQGKRALDATGVIRRHLLVVTDGENTDGFDPGDVTAAIGHRPFDERPTIYFVAFDIEASRFQTVRDGGGFVLEAASGKALGETIDSLLRGKILIEKD